MSGPLSRFYRWEMLGLLFCAYFLHQADRAIYGVLLSSIKEDLNLTDTQVGLTATVLFLVLAVMVPVAGFLGDRWSKKWIITCSLIFWSCATMLTGLAGGLVGLILFRSVATGGGESFYGPASTALIAAYHKKTRALALSIHQASLYIGIMCSGFLAGHVAEQYGWRAAFYIFGGFGILLGGILIFRLHDPPSGSIEPVDGNVKKNPMENLQDMPGDENVLTQTQEAELERYTTAQAVKKLVRIPTVLLLTVGFTAVVVVNNSFLTWIPRFIEMKFGISQLEAGSNSMFFHHSTALVGVLLGGFLADGLSTRFPRFRLGLQSAAMLAGAPMIYLLGGTDSLSMLWLVIAVFGALRGLYESNTHAAMFDVVPPNLRSTVVGLMIMTAFLIGSLPPVFLGYLAERLGPEKGLALGFQILSASWLIGGCCVFTAFCFTLGRDRIKTS